MKTKSQITRRLRGCGSISRIVESMTLRFKACSACTILEILKQFLEMDYKLKQKDYGISENKCIRRS